MDNANDKDNYVHQVFGVHPAQYASGTTASAPSPATQAADPAGAAAVNVAGMVIVSAARIGQLDADVTASLLGLIDKASTLTGDMYGIAALAKVDINNPQAAIAPLKAADGKIAEQDRVNLKTALAALNAEKDASSSLFIQFRDKSMELRRTIDDLLALPQETELAKVDPEEAKDDIEHLYDGAIQCLKFALEISDAPASALLELFGTDFAKDAVKAGDNQALLVNLKAGVEVLERNANALVKTLGGFGAAQAKDDAKTLGDLVRALHTAHDHIRFAAKNFKDVFDKVVAKAIKNSAGKPAKKNPDAERVLGVFKAIQAANTAYQEARNALTRTKTLNDTKYWANLLVPLGNLVLDGTDSGKPGSVAGSMMVYQGKGAQIAFYLPASGLTHAMSDLSSAVEKAQKLDEPTGGAVEMEKLCDSWTEALAEGI